MDSYQKFQSVLKEITNYIGLNKYRISRVDFALDYFEDNYYELHKLNKCICLLLAISNNLKNRYESTDPLTLDHLTTRVQSEYLECENYNKDIQSNHYSPVYNRLELRSKALFKTKKDIPDLILGWCKRLDKTLTYFPELQDACNKELIRRWEKETGFKVKSESEFLRKYQDNIYTTSQLEDLYKQLGFENINSKIKNFKRYNSFEYFTEKNIRSYIDKLKVELEGYIAR